MEEVKSKFNIKKIFLIIIMVIIGIVLLVFVSTYFRWCDQKSKLNLVYGYSDESKIVYEYNNKEYEVESLKDFYGDNISNIELKENEYIELYCDKKDCIYIDNNDNNITMYLNPGVIILVLSVIMLLFYYLFMRVAELKKRTKIISFMSLLILTIVIFFMFIVDFANYYGIVNNSTYFAEGKVVGVIYNSDSEYKELIKYEVLDKSYFVLGNSNTKEINDVINSSRNIYYSKKDNSIADIKRFPLNVILLVSFVIFVGFSILYGLFIKHEKEG